MKPTLSAQLDIPRSCTPRRGGVGWWLGLLALWACDHVAAQEPAGGDPYQELITPSAWQSQATGAFPLAVVGVDATQLLVPDAWLPVPVQCGPLLEPYQRCMPSPELITPGAWQGR